MKGLESQFGKIKPQNLEESPFYGIKSEDSLEPQSPENIDVPFLNPESLGKVFALHELKINFTENLSDGEIYSFMNRVHDFEDLLKEKAKKGELMYGDNIIGVDDLNKFALYCILIGTNFEKAMWLDFDGAMIEKFMIENYKKGNPAQFAVS